MKLKKLFIGLVSTAALISLAACGEEEKPGDNPPKVSQSVDNNTPSQKESTSEPLNTEALVINSYKEQAVSKLDQIINPLIAKISDSELKAKVQEFYNTEKTYINSITDKDTAIAAANKVVSDASDFAVNTFKPMIIPRINAVINPLIEAIPDSSLKSSVQTFYNTEIAKVDSKKDLEGLVNVYKEIVDDTKAYIKTETEKLITALKDKALEELDPYITALINKIPFDDIKEDTNTLYAKELLKLQAVNTIDGVTPCLTEIKDDLLEFAISESKKFAIEEIEKLVTAGLDKLPNDTIKKDLTDFATEEIDKLNDVDKLEDIKPTLDTILSETASFIKQYAVDVVKGYLADLLNVESRSAFDYLPEAMLPSYSANLVKASDINYDFTNNTNVSAINKAGYGEQWQMVIENINQSKNVSNVFNYVQTALSAATNLVNIYITNSYSESMNYSFSGAGFTGLFAFDGSYLKFNIELSSSVTIPVAGTVKPKISMEYDLDNATKAVYISLGDAYKLRYVVGDSYYEMATTYGISIAGASASRTSALTISKNKSGKYEGHIYEYTTAVGKDLVKACADFYIDDNYVSVVGNKASGMMLFDGYINELYNVNEGRLLGYEVKEELEFAGVVGTYNTLWFNLWDINGINSVKVLDKSSDNASSKSTVDVYVNGSSNLLSPTYNKILVKKTSRKYDIEYRSRFYYTYDEEANTYNAVEVLVPMMFIQEGDNFDSFVSDIKADNNITASVQMPKAYLDKILADYDTLIDVFVTNKELMTRDFIIQYLSQFEN